MKVKIYAIRDHVAGFMQPMSRQNDEIMIRDFKLMCADPAGNILNLNPADYSLWSLGDYDIDSGVIESKPQWLMNAADLRVKEDKPDEQ